MKESKPIDANVSKPKETIEETKPIESKESKPVESKDSKPVEINGTKSAESNDSKPEETKDSKPVEKPKEEPKGYLARRQAAAAAKVMITSNLVSRRDVFLYMFVNLSL